MTLSWCHFACSCILMGREVNTIATGAHYLCSKKRGIEKGKGTFNWHLEANKSLTERFSSVFYLGQQVQNGEVKIEAWPYPTKRRADIARKRSCPIQYTSPKLSVTYNMCARGVHQNLATINFLYGFYIIAFYIGFWVYLPKMGAGAHL